MAFPRVGVELKLQLQAMPKKCHAKRKKIEILNMVPCVISKSFLLTDFIYSLFQIPN